MTKEEKQKVNKLCNSIIMIANKFINKVETGGARSKETYQDMMLAKKDAEMLKEEINNYNK